ncbi:MAG: HAD family hydrolase [Gemmataceae bacterium]
MPLNLEQYAKYLDTRGDLFWPAPPEVEPIRARPHLVRLSSIRLIYWNIYGTLLAIPLGELVFEHPQAFIMNNALEKTIQEFKMWASMSRKPGQPADYMISQYRQILAENSSSSSGERHPEAQAEKIWETILKRLMQKDYKFDASFYGSINELSRKVAYFFHASLQGTACYDGAAEAMQHCHNQGIKQGLLADAQCFTTVQLQRGLNQQDPSLRLEEVVAPERTALSCEVRGKKPSERLFRKALDLAREQGVAPNEILHVGSQIVRDLVPAKRLGMHTALFVGDRASAKATPEQLKDPATRPDVLLTHLPQLVEVVG